MIKVFRIKDLIKCFLSILIPIIILIVIMQNLTRQKSKETNILTNARPLFNCISSTITQFQIIENETKEEKQEGNKGFIFLSELKILSNIKESNKPKEENVEEIKEEEVTENIVETKKADTGLKTEVVENSVKPRVTNEYEGVQINNTSDKELTEDILKPDIEIKKEKVIIYHTHTCESYTPTEKFNYEASGNYRSIDLSFSVARVGDELETQLKEYNITTIHDKTYHDYPSYNGSYSRSLVTAQNALSNNQDADIIIDLHRDAIADANYAPKVKIGEEYASQLMFVIGVNHDNWNQNLKSAIKIMKKANELYPGLFKPIILRNAEYNQHLAKAGCIIEVGATGNTLEESINSMKYLAKVISEI